MIKIFSTPNFRILFIIIASNQIFEKCNINTRKIMQKKKLIDKQCDGNINTVAEELISSENIASQVWVHQLDIF